MSVLLKVILLSILADAQKAAVRAAEEEIAHAEAAEAARIEQKMVKEEQAHQKAVKDANAKKAKGEALSKEEAKLAQESEQASAGRKEASSTANGSSSASRRGAKEESAAEVKAAEGAAEAAGKFEASNVGKVEGAADKNAMSKVKEHEAKDLEFNSKAREIKNQQAFKDMPDAIVEELSRKNVPVDHIQRNEVISLKPGEPKGTMYSYTNHVGEPVILELDAAGSVVSMKKASYKEIFNPKNYTKERMNSSNPLLRMGKNPKMPRTYKGKVIGKKYNRYGRVNRRGVPKRNAGKFSGVFDRAIGIIGAVAMVPMVLITPSMLGYYGENGHFGGSWTDGWSEWFNSGDFKTKDLCDGCGVEIWDLDGGALATEEGFKDICGNYIDTVEWALIAPVDRDNIEGHQYLGAPCVSHWIPLMDGSSDWRPDEFRGCPLGVGEYYIYEYTMNYPWDNFLTGEQTDVWFFKNAYGEMSDCHGNTVSDWMFQERERLFQGGFGLSDNKNQPCTQQNPESLCHQIWRWPNNCQENNGNLQYPRGYPMELMKKCYQPMNEYQFWKQWVVNAGWSHCNDDPKTCGGQTFTNFGGVVWDQQGINDMFFVEAFNETMLFEEELLWLTTDGALPQAQTAEDGTVSTNLKRPPFEIIEATFGAGDTDVYEFGGNSIVVEEWWCNANKLVANASSDNNDMALQGVYVDANAYVDGTAGVDVLQVENHVVYSYQVEEDQFCTVQYWADFYKDLRSDILESNDITDIEDLPLEPKEVNALYKTYHDMGDALAYMWQLWGEQTPLKYHMLKKQKRKREREAQIEEATEKPSGIGGGGNQPAEPDTTTKKPSGGRGGKPAEPETTTKKPSGGRGGNQPAEPDTTTKKPSGVGVSPW